MFLICSGMYRSGSTLQYQIVADIVEKHSTGGRVLGWSHHREFNNIAMKFSGEESYIVYKNHVLTDEMKDLVAGKLSYVFYIYRDIRDVAVSMMQKQGITFDQLVSSGALDSCIDHYYECVSLGSVYISKYEDVIEDIESEVLSIANLLECGLTSHDVYSIANNLSLGSQLNSINEYKKNNQFVEISTQTFHPRTLLHHNHIKDGAVGKYKHILSAGEVLLLNKKYQYWLNDAGYSVDG